MSIIDEYHQRRPTFLALADKAERLIKELIGAENARVHSVTTRVKSVESLEDKLVREPGKYDCLERITDICGARIITYFEDDVDSVASVIEREFLIDRANSTDKRAALDVDRFGYASVHYVVHLDQRREILSEYARFAGMSFEVQIRSILQHAWAEIEHDLQYKSKESIPRELRRRFARLCQVCSKSQMLNFAAFEMHLMIIEAALKRRSRFNQRSSLLIRSHLHCSWRRAR